MPLRAGSSQKTASKPPYGLSFSLEDLVAAKEWTERLQLSLRVVLDHVMENAEFEEVLIVSSVGTQRRILTLWNTGLAIHAQAPQGRPRSFGTMAQALESARPRSGRRQPWRFFQS